MPLPGHSFTARASDAPMTLSHERYLLAVEKTSPLALRSEIDIEDLRSERIIAFSRQNLSYSERYFSEMFETHGLTGNIAYRSHEE